MRKELIWFFVQSVIITDNSYIWVVTKYNIRRDGDGEDGKQRKKEETFFLSSL